MNFNVLVFSYVKEFLIAELGSGLAYDYGYFQSELIQCYKEHTENYTGNNAVEIFDDNRSNKLSGITYLLYATHELKTHNKKYNNFKII